MRHTKSHYNKSTCSECSKLIGVYDANYITDFSSGEEKTRLVCKHCFELWTGIKLNTQQLLKQLKYNEQRDRNVNSPVPIKKRW